MEAEAVVPTPTRRPHRHQPPQPHHYNLNQQRGAKRSGDCEPGNRYSGRHDLLHDRQQYADSGLDPIHCAVPADDERNDQRHYRGNGLQQQHSGQPERYRRGPSGSLAWSDEFTNATATNAQPNSSIWTYDTGNSGFGNNELENYCAWGSNTSPCSSASPNAYVAPGGGLNIVAMQPSAGVYTSARMKTEGLFSFQYGRIEAKLMIPESQGMWPAFWLLGNNITTINWPACGELDVMEHINGNDPENLGYDWTQSSIHGTGLGAGTPYTTNGFSAAAWHTYGMIWTKGQIQYYVDNPANIYETFTTTNPGTGTWPFDQGPQFILLNLAVGGNWPGSPDATTVFPAKYQVAYVRIYAN